MKIALVHDQLREFGGAERVLVSLKKLFPDAPVYTSTYDNNSLGSHKELVKNWDIRVSWFGKIPLINALYSPLRFLTPLIWKSFNFSDYDLVLSSTGSWMCKGINSQKPTIHISYVHHPPRYLYGYETAIEWQKHLIIKIYGTIINYFLRQYDFEISQKVDFFIANSEETKKRIQKFYRRDSTVIYPPVTIPPVSATSYQLPATSYFLTVSRLARAKHVDILIKAANKQKFNLKIVGKGRDEVYLRSIAGPTVEFIGNVTDKEISEIYSHAKAFLFASVDEEFGISPIEAMGYGIPVIAYKSGGLIETVKNGQNGYLFEKLDPDSLVQKIITFESLTENEKIEMKKSARTFSEQFSEERFHKEIKEFIKNIISNNKKLL